MKTWEPCIPGTEHDRIKFIVLMQSIHRDPLSAGVFRSTAIKQLAGYNLLSTPQIGRVVGCGVRATKTVLDAMGVPPVNTRGKFDPRALPGLLLVCTHLAAGERPDKMILAELTKLISPTLMEKLTGVPLSTFNDYRKKAESR